MTSTSSDIDILENEVGYLVCHNLESNINDINGKLNDLVLLSAEKARAMKSVKLGPSVTKVDRNPWFDDECLRQKLVWKILSQQSLRTSTGIENLRSFLQEKKRKFISNLTKN